VNRDRIPKSVINKELIYFFVDLKVVVKFSVCHAKAQSGNKGIVLFFLELGMRGRRAPAALLPGKKNQLPLHCSWLGCGVGLDRHGKSHIHMGLNLVPSNP
jgi:hypothetical protein